MVPLQQCVTVKAVLSLKSMRVINIIHKYPIQIEHIAIVVEWRDFTNNLFAQSMKTLRLNSAVK